MIAEELDKQDAATPRPLPGLRRPSYQVALAIGVFVSVSALLLFTPARSLLTILFPALALLCSVILYSRSKPAYVAFVLWIWFLTPFVRRVVDEQAGSEQAILLAPYLVAAIAAFYVLRHLRVLATTHAVPFVCALAAIFYGLCIGCVQFSPLIVGQTLCEWLVPVLFAIFIFVQHDEPDRVRKSFLNAFCILLILSAAYAIVQFYAAPSWDMNWLARNQEDLVEIGPAVAMQFRVFSTMNSPTVFGVALMTGMLMIPVFPKALRIPAGALGLAAILLTGSRSAWIGFAGGAIYLFARANRRRRALMLLQLAGMIVLVLGLLRAPVLGEFLSDRFSHFTDIQADASYGDRMQGYKEAFSRLAHEPFGEGLGSAQALHIGEVIGPHDSSFLESLYSLGWLGTALYAVALTLAGIGTFRLPADPVNADFVDAGRAVFLAFVVQSPLNSIMLGQAGFILWTMVALTLKEIQLGKSAETAAIWQPVVRISHVDEAGALALPDMPQ